MSEEGVADFVVGEGIRSVCLVVGCKGVGCRGVVEIEGGVPEEISSRRKLEQRQGRRLETES